MPPHQASYEIDEVSVEFGSSLPVDNWQKDGECDSTSKSVDSPCLSRCVSFVEDIQVHSIMSHEDYTFMERKSSWRSPYEVHQSKFHFDKVVSRIQQGKPCKGDMTYRGLEQFCPSGDQGLHINSRELVKAVLNEQKRLMELESCDPEAIASVSIAISERCRLRALELAKEDECEVQSILEAERPKRKSAPNCRRSSWWTLGAPRKRHSTI